MRYFTALGLILALVLAFSGCAAPASTATPTPPPQPTATSAPQPTATSTPQAIVSGPTAGQLADLGKAVYDASCAGCHGSQGEGASAAALVGARARLDRYGDALGLLEYFGRTMPRGSPGSLSEEKNLQILAWILVQNNFVYSSTVLEESDLSETPLAK